MPFVFGQDTIYFILIDKMPLALVKARQKSLFLKDKIDKLPFVFGQDTTIFFILFWSRHDKNHYFYRIISMKCFLVLVTAQQKSFLTDKIMQIYNNHINC
jgi:hypothetical protein